VQGEAAPALGLRRAEANSTPWPWRRGDQLTKGLEDLIQLLIVLPGLGPRVTSRKAALRSRVGLSAFPSEASRCAAADLAVESLMRGLLVRQHVVSSEEEALAALAEPRQTLPGRAP
jgi:hypothetical protein